MDSAETPRRRRTVDVHAVGPRPLPSARQQPTPGHPAPFPGRDYRLGTGDDGVVILQDGGGGFLTTSPAAGFLCCIRKTTIEKSRLLSEWRPGRRRPLRPQRISFTIHGRPVHLFRDGTSLSGRLQTDHGSAGWSAQLRLGEGVRCLPLVAATVDVSTRLRYRS